MGKRLVSRFAILLVVLFFAQIVCAQTFAAPASGNSSDANARLAKLEQQAADAKSSADNAWMLTSAALVLMMTGPGLALF
jgi:ammonium transporter, Amt family